MPLNNIKLTLGIRDGQEFVIYSIFPSKASKRKRNRQRKPQKAPTPPCEEVVEQREGPSEPIPLSESTFSPMKTRQNKRKRQEKREAILKKANERLIKKNKENGDMLDDPNIEDGAVGNLFDDN